MNDPINTRDEGCCKEVNDFIRKNPVPVILAGLGLGLLLATLLRPRKPARPESRVLGILEDIQDRMKEIAEPVYDRAYSAAEKGAGALKEGIDHLSDVDLPSSIDSLRRKISRLFR